MESSQGRDSLLQKLTNSKLGLCKWNLQEMYLTLVVRKSIQQSYFVLAEMFILDISLQLGLLKRRKITISRLLKHSPLQILI